MVTVRACDSCVCRRAQWYCAADDAFLCQNCDSSVHSANPLARRHDRVRLQTNSISLTRKLAPAWHHGFKRKARTPRPCKAKIPATAAQPLVPEIETSNEDESNREEQLLYQVPIFDPVIAEFCVTPNLELKPSSSMNCTTSSNNNDRFLAGFLQSDMELAEFAANMEGLLGHNDSFSMEELGLVDAKHMSGSSSNHEVKEELENSKDVHKDVYEEIDLSRETLEINFDAEDKETTKTMAVAVEEEEEEEEGKSNNRIGLRLDYEAIAVEWSANGGCLSPWMNGERPRLGPDDWWLHFMGMWGVGEAQGIIPGEIGGSHFDEGREARVSRYREKRRTRLFSKKIRYEVRKLNAEKRPRIKGRFVKRALFAATAATALFNYYKK